MGQTATSLSGSLQTGASSTHETAAPPAPTLVWAAVNASRPLRVEGAISIDALIARREADPTKAALLAQARQRLAGEMPVSPLGTLRMRHGLSQRALAERCGMGQPHVAKIEQATHDPKTSTVQRMAEAMGCAPEAVLRAVLETQNWARRP